jgi:hypothetical protein
MPNPAALLATSTSLSAMLGGTVPAGNGTGGTAAQGANGVDFTSLLSGSTGFAAASTPRPPLSAAAASAAKAPATTPEEDDDSDQAAASGKNLPLAALSAAILPVPVTLSALTQAGSDQSAATSTTAQDQSAGTAADTTPAPSIALQDPALMLMAQTVNATPLQTTTGPTGTGTNTGTNTGAAIAANAAAQTATTTTTASSAYQTVAATAQTGLSQPTAPLPHPGFTLIPDGTPLTIDSGDQTPTAGGAADLTTPTTGTSSPADSTLTAAAQPGFTLLDPDTPATDGSDAAVTLAQGQAQAQTPVTLQADAAIAMADPSYLPAIGARPGFATLSQTVNGAGASGTTAQLAASSPVATTLATTLAAQGATAQNGDAISPGFATIQLADATPGTAPKLTAARKITAQGQTAATRAAGGAGNGKPPATAADSDDQPGFPSLHSPTSPSADGASTADNAPNHVPSLASAGAAASQTLAMGGGAPTSQSLLTTAASTTTAQQAATPTTDMAALVDRLVEARAAARSGLGAQSTLASITHADFGRVSLRFDQDDAGLSISMTSKDPAFAPAAQAALAQAPAVGASGQGHGASAQGNSQQGSSQGGQQWAQASQSTLGSGSAGTNSSGAQGGNQGGQNGAAPARTPAQASLASASIATGSGGDQGVRRRGGILA